MKRNKWRALGLFVVFVLSFLLPAFPAYAATPEVDEEFVFTYQPTSGAINPPTIIVDAVNEATLGNVISAKEKPSNIILRMDGMGNVVSKNGDTMATFTEVEARLQRVIPILYIKDEASADGVLTYFSQTKTILDIAVMSTDGALIRKVKDVYPAVRGILETDGTQSEGETLLQAREAGAVTLVLPQENATAERVTYFQSRFQTVWVRAEREDNVALADCIFSGAYGMVVQDAQKAYDLYATFPENTYVRAPFIVAHRGDIEHAHENSLSGIAEAAKNGATHVELNFHVTKDKALVCMHDEELSRTTNGVGKIAEMTLADLDRYQIDIHKNALPEKIPTFEECAEEILKTNMIFVVELKGKGVEIVQVLRDTLMKNATLSPILERMTVITFSTEQLAKMQELLPQVPTANLNNVSKPAFASVLQWMGEYNTGIDTALSNLTPMFQNDLKDRGIIGWSYTYETFADAQKAQRRGLMGLTTNQPSAYAEEVRSIETEDVSSSFSLSEGMEVEVQVTDYNGTVTRQVGKIAYVEKEFLNNRAIAEVEVDGYHYYTQAFQVEKTGVLPLLVSVVVSTMVLLGAAIVLVILLKKEAEKRTEVTVIFKNRHTMSVLNDKIPFSVGSGYHSWKAEVKAIKSC